MDATLCTFQNCKHDKSEECIRRNCMSKVSSMLKDLDKNVKRNIAVHENNLESFKSKLLQAKTKEEKHTLNVMIKRTNDFLRMYRAYQNTTSEKDKMKWYIKYFM